MLNVESADTVNSIWVFSRYGDGVQAEAVAASISARSLPHCILIIHSEHLPKLHMSNVTIIYTMGHYALNLANNINNMEVLHSGYNSSVDVSQLDSILSSLQPLDFVILVVNPQEAPDICLEFPWWYFGADHVTAFGPADEFETDNKLLRSPSSQPNKSRTYTPYLIDTVTAYFEVCDALWNYSLSITAENILKALSRSGPLETHPCFQGCTGLVAIDRKSEC
ncbi:unnamed protein product [Sphagnum troendelagicum]